MKTPVMILLSGAALAACSQPLPTANNTSAVEVNGVEAVMPSEANLAADDAAAPAEAATMTNEAAAAGPTEASGDDAYYGRWIGVEGMFLNVAAKPGGGVTMDMQWDLDHRGTFDGSVTAEGLRFMRNGVAETAVRTDGDATGLKYLAGKKDCLTVKPGEGYCRDR